jgi:hypothetical protein
MKRIWTSIMLSIMGMALLALACNTTVPSGGDDEVVAQFIPDGIELDIAEVPDESGKSKVTDRCTGLPQYDRTLRAGAGIIFAFHRFTDHSLALAAQIHNDITNAAATSVSGTFIVNGQEVAYVADFAAFDIDGDGIDDGSGQPGVEPVAMRVWVDRGMGFERFLCALVTTRPSTDNLGAGQMYVHPNAANADAFEDLNVHVEWNRTDANHKWNQATISGQIRDEVAVTIGQQRVDVRTNVDTSIEKTIRSTNLFSDSPSGFGTYAFAAHFLRGGTNVLMSGETTGGTFNVNFDSVCLDLEGCSIDVSGNGCAAFDTQDMSLLGEPTVGSADFPTGFPETPSVQ